jgi:hypothetical protein
MPPASLVEQLLGIRFAPAPELAAWARGTFIAEGGALQNPDHSHLADASLGFLWASAGFMTKGKRVLGMAEDLRLGVQGHAWRRARAEQQFSEWFGMTPDFLITVDAFAWAEMEDAAACALLEHELYHVAHRVDEFGAPAYTKDGQPKLALHGHDVEEFVGVVRRYGVGDPDSSLGRMIIAAAHGPRVEPARIAHACGTCLART